MNSKTLNQLIKEGTDDTEFDMPATQYSVWSKLANNVFAPGYNTCSSVPSGLYEIAWNNSMSSHVLQKREFQTDELITLPGAEHEEILADITKFWQRRDKYAEFKFTHKRGILLYGQPGCGKSGIIHVCIKDLINNYNGIVINVTNEDSMYMYIEFIETIRKIEPERPIIVLLEDIDALIQDHSSNVSKLLNILDGIKQIDNVVYIATTNYPERLEERISNRPSRFDRRFEISLPDANIRRAFIQAKAKGYDIDIETWVKATDTMSLAHVKELVISVLVLGNTLEDSIARLNGLKTRPRVTSSNKLGFK